MSYLVPPLLNASLNNITYPITYTKTLMQLGHEPLPSYRGHSWGLIGKPVIRLPSGWAYMKHIIKTDGFIGLGRGFGSRIICDVIFRVVQDRGNAALMEALGRESEEEKASKTREEKDLSVRELFEDCTIETCSKMAAIVVSQPFYVVSIRAMAQFIGREAIYGIPFISSFRDIWTNDGIAGFFAGLIPRAICEIVNLWLGKILYHLMCKYIFTDDNYQIKSLQAYGRLLTPTLTSYVTYPFALTSTIMAVNGSSLAAGNMPVTPVYSSWLECLRDLIQSNDTSRGAAFFIRIRKI